MSDLSQFNPQNAQELIGRIKSEVKDSVIQHWAVVRGRVEGNLEFLANTTLRTAELLARGEINEAEADAILYQQELLLNVTLNASQAYPYSIAQRALNSIFKVVGWAVKNKTGVDIFAVG